VQDVAATSIAEFFERIELNQGEMIYGKNDQADAIFVLESGMVQACDSSHTANGAARVVLAPTASADTLSRSRGLLRYEAGTIFGEVEFFLRHKRYFGTMAASKVVLHRLDWAAFDRLQATAPTLGCAFQTALMRWVCRWVAVDINDGRRHHGKDRFTEDEDE
jgi:CRP-like cAMP-binding protein